MKYIHYIIVLVIGLITSFFIWSYIQRSNLEYNTEGRLFSSEDGVVYHEQTKEIYGILSLLGLVMIILFIRKLIKKK